MAGQKTFVLDTNILISSPNAIYGFDDNHVVITSTTLQELDGLKSAPGETGFRAREAIRFIAQASASGKLLEGVIINETAKKHGTFRVEPNGTSVCHLPKGFSIDKPDNRIINSTLSIKEENPGSRVVLVTNDISMRVNAEVCGLEVQGYKNEQLETDNYYTGRQEIIISSSVMNKLYAIDNKKVKEEREFYIKDYLTKSTCPEFIEANEYVVFKDELGGQLVGRCTENNPEHGYKIRLLDKTLSPMEVSPRNVGQRMAIDALMAPVEEIPIVFLKGKAGTAKTFLSLAAGLEQQMDDKFDKVMITRTNTLSDADMGFLPGSLEDKMGPLVAPFIDNLESLFKLSGASHKKSFAGYMMDDDETTVSAMVNDLFERQAVEICAVAYMRGRSISNAYLIIDEAQNSTIGQILEIVTRAGEGTKIVICGDPDQIDNPRLDRLNNGLVFASEKMKGSSLCAQITFTQEETVRSKLASEAAIRLNNTGRR